MPIALDHVHELDGPLIALVMIAEVTDLALNRIRAAVDDVPHQSIASGALIGCGLLHRHPRRVVVGLECRDEFQRAGFTGEQ
ncbi:hypothetical protein D3C85_1501190 [compost metagenome]